MTAQHTSLRRFLSTVTVLALAMLWMQAPRSSAQSYILTLNDAQPVGPAITYRPGVNIGAMDYWDSGQLTKNLLAEDNAGFEYVKQKSIWTLFVAGTNNSFSLKGTDDWATYALNFFQGATVDVVESATAARGCKSLVAGNNAVSPATFTLATPCAAALGIGDELVITNTRLPTPQADWEASDNGVWTNISGGGHLLSDTATPYDGAQSLILDVTAGAGAHAGITEYFDPYTSQNHFVLLNGTYQASVWAKANGVNKTLTVCAGRPPSSCQDFTLTPTWAQYSKTFTFTETNTAPFVAAGMAVSTSGANGLGQVEVDNMSLVKTSSQDATNTSIFRDEVVAALRQWCATSTSGAKCMIRDWVNQNGKEMSGWTMPAISAPQASSGGDDATTGQPTPQLYDYLYLTNLVGGVPYIELPVTFSAADAAAFVEYMSSTNTTSGWGAVRAKQGQLAPWVGAGGVFPQVYATFCNECWNGGSFSGQALYYRNGALSYYFDYANRAKDIYAAMRVSPSFTASMRLGFAMQLGITYDVDKALALMASVHGSPNFVEQAAYMPQTISKWKTIADLWSSTLYQPYGQAMNVNAVDHFQPAVRTIQGYKLCGATSTEACEATQYESGPGTVSTCGYNGRPACNGTEGNTAIDQAHEDFITAGGATALVYPLAYAMNQLKLGMAAQNTFALDEWSNNGAGTTSGKLWGAVADMGGSMSYVDSAPVRWRPQGLGMAVLSQAIIGQGYACNFAGGPVYQWPGDAVNGPTAALANVPYLNAFCFQSATQRSMVIFNTNQTASYTATFAGTNAPAGTCAQQQIVLSSPNAMNEGASGTNSTTAVANVHINTTSAACLTTLPIPPLSETAITYTPGGVVIIPPPPPAQVTAVKPVFTMQSPVTISMTTTTPGAAIYYTLDGSNPTIASTLYTAPVVLTKQTYVKAIAVVPGSPSSVTTAVLFAIH